MPTKKKKQPYTPPNMQQIAQSLGMPDSIVKQIAPVTVASKKVEVTDIHREAFTRIVQINKLDPLFLHQKLYEATEAKRLGYVLGEEGKPVPAMVPDDKTRLLAVQLIMRLMGLDPGSSVKIEGLEGMGQVNNTFNQQNIVITDEVLSKIEQARATGNYEALQNEYRKASKNSVLGITSHNSSASNIDATHSSHSLPPGGDAQAFQGEEAVKYQEAEFSVSETKEVKE